MSRFDINVPTVFGCGTVNQVGEEAKNLGISRALLVHGTVLPEQHVQKVRNSLKAAGIELQSTTAWPRMSQTTR